MKKTEGLQSYFNFTESDLEENIQGRVTQGQKVRLREKLQRDIFLIVMLFIILIVVSLIIIPSSTLIPIVMAVAMTITLIFRIILKSDYSLDYAEGPVNFFWEERRIRDENNLAQSTTRKLRMKVGDKSFDVREELLDVLDQGDNCCFYFTNGGDIVSAEFLGK